MRRLGPIAAALLAGLAVLAGCSARKTLLPNIEPETSLFVQGPVDTVSHTVHLYWFGTDPDGEVVAFELRFHNPAAPADTAWVRTTRSDSLFVVHSPGPYTAPRFEVRAIDDQGAVDRTPAVQDFQFSNQAPVVSILSKPLPSDTTFASLTLSWIGGDVDGSPALLTYRLWLNGNEAGARIVTSPFTIPSEDFKLGGVYTTGPRTVYVQAIDGGGRAGAPDSARWFVRAPVTGSRARLLLIDDVPTTNAADAATDALYANAAARNLPAGTYSVLRLQTTQPFRSVADVAQTFGLFESVIWYRGSQPTFSTLLRDYQAGIDAYLDAGGRFYVESYDLVDGLNAPGPLSEDFLIRRLGSDRLLLGFSASLGDSTAEWGNVNGDTLRSDMFQDSLSMRLFARTVRAFAVRDPSYVAVYAPPGALTPSNTISMPVAVSVPQSPGTGRVMAMTFPLVLADRLGSAGRFLDKVFQQFGLTGP